MTAAAIPHPLHNTHRGICQFENECRDMAVVVRVVLESIHIKPLRGGLVLWREEFLEWNEDISRHGVQY
jgi:hypothetical protein